MGAPFQEVLKAKLDRVLGSLRWQGAQALGLELRGISCLFQLKLFDDSRILSPLPRSKVACIPTCARAWLQQKKGPPPGLLMAPYGLEEGKYSSQQVASLLHLLQQGEGDVPVSRTTVCAQKHRMIPHDI